MWRWDQGHLEYFQFEAVRQISGFVVQHDFKAASRAQLRASTGLTFSAPATHSPWRNYSRALKLCLLVSEVGPQAIATPVAQLLSQPGAIICDEYMHFLACASSSPSPALNGWDHTAELRYPLLFTLKYLLTKRVITDEPFASLNEILGAYDESGFSGEEGQEEFIAVVGDRATYEATGSRGPDNLRRQARESLKVIAQISYLSIQDGRMFVSLDPKDAHEIFDELTPVLGPHEPDGEAEIRRLVALFNDGATAINFEYPNTVTEDVVQSGFREGTKVKKTHVTIERNTSLRKEFFAARPSAVCDVCTVDTASSYPWTERVLDLHHLLPLSSGTRVEATGTTFDDLVAVCPSCHRAIHRFYDRWLGQHERKDFKDGREALGVYNSMKAQFPGLIHA